MNDSERRQAEAQLMDVRVLNERLELFKRKAAAFDEIKREIKLGAEWGMRDRIEDIIDSAGL